MEENILQEARRLLTKLVEQPTRCLGNEGELANSFSLLATAEATTRQAAALERIANRLDTMYDAAMEEK